ncbi:MAG TPA: 6-carboxytetrahydropterin synthase [Bacteroidales bacterium]|nr:6-carboxytetrahydropterin synthase [Bacteroidales bacterium]HPF03026.1 6-carboxytetrahydropterin synthase [Bacteroidales bacterium]HPJ59836.1 6-carboxytetrahydropterin synthase [Bacteroidales bacterium]HPR12716.1 6-carboxytetrahydropterin synthase [Bacteroidales bacterium]HRW85586.1 6-carboxytetrahydropterin synthase [Bacteroidales bacterium]
MIYITRRERFSAAHRMFRADWSDEKNMEVFGKCSNPTWHGHNYVLWVTVKGELSEDHGFVMNLTTLKKIINGKVIDKLDHRNMNTDVDFMAGKIATTENLAIAIWNELKPVIEKEGAMLHCVKVEETENNYIEYYG